ncbi:MAG TPA: aldehyde dehydrogenase (NADP(+)) [Bryobacteraceae bacterium]|nr:aldehyde dehydrogenase (NADP(+)) [Bryobacteraceae bacterium]
MTELKDSTPAEIDRAATRADDCLEFYAALAPVQIGALLERIAAEIEALGAELIERAAAETALPPARLTGERARTTNQLRMFADLVREGTWKDVRIERALPDRKPARRPDLRRTMIPIGPVAVWAASNFPLAFSVAGGDTASALAAGCPVVVKAHPGHPETSELVAGAVAKALAALGLPAGIFSMVQGSGPEVSLELVRHPKMAAGAFTGSLRAGRALFDAAARRPAPIPFFAEMGSVNPVFLLEGALYERGEAIAEGLSQSVNLGVGQFCTCPGLAAAVESPALERLAAGLRDRFRRGTPGTMLTRAIARSYHEAVERMASIGGVNTSTSRPAASAEAWPVLFEAGAATVLAHEELREEVFGPSTVLVRCGSGAELLELARHLEGSLTATIHGTVQDLGENGPLVALLARKAGRLVFNGFPTGVEVSAAMQHGGPYPATTDPRFTSVGTAAILRFARPVCFQDFPPELLPPELQDGATPHTS